MDIKQTKQLSLKAATVFAAEHGIEREVAEIRSMRIDWDTQYKSSLKRGFIVELFEREGVFSLFKERYWHYGNTPQGETWRRRYLRLLQQYREFLTTGEARQEAEETDAHPSDRPSEELCANLFAGFTFRDLRTASPPKRKGVYVIRVKQEGKSIGYIVQHISRIVHTIAWPMLEKKVLSRINRLNRMSHCPIIYIGSAGTRAGSNNTLADRYREFGGRHTAMYPVWALLYFGWELEYGWKEEDKPGDLEEELKEEYRHIHGGTLPALVQR